MRPKARRSIRLVQFDYRSAGCYFITVCLREREHLLGDVINGEVVLNAAGKIVESAIIDIGRRNNHMGVDTFVVMPDHFHLILSIKSPKDGQPSDRKGAKPRGTLPGSIGAIVQNLKSLTSRRINRLHGVSGRRVWQRNYWERVIRDEAERDQIREYIVTNPQQWEERFESTSP